MSEAAWRYVLAVTGCILGFVSTLLVSSWAQNDNTSSQSGYLEKPDWQDNPFAYHPVLTVGGFMMGQIFGAAAWVVIPNRRAAKCVHVLCQTGALICMCYGLSSVVKYKNDAYENALTSAHSWVGVASVSFFCVNYCLGALMGILTQFMPDSKLRSNLDLRRIHRATGFISMGMCALACVSGIMNQLSYGFCGLKDNNDYSDLPHACRIANGMGVAIMAACMCIVAASSLREDPEFEEKIPSSSSSTQQLKEVEMEDAGK